MFKAQQDLDLAERALAVGLVLEGADLLDSHAHLAVPVESRAVEREVGGCGLANVW